MTIFGNSDELKTKTPKTRPAYIFFRWRKGQRVEFIQMQNPTYGFVVIYVIEKARTSQKRNDVITFYVT